jgi:C_GCAxxG_C_C family probable redox protein
MSEKGKYSAPEMLEKAACRVDELMGKYRNCAQCTLVAIQEATGMRDDVLAKAATGLAGGIGGTQSVCGALTGGALALGMVYGRDAGCLQGPEAEAIRKQGPGVEQVARLAKWFEREFKSTMCGELKRSFAGVPLSMDVPWQRQWAEQLGMMKNCNAMAAKTAQRVLAMLDNAELSIVEEA